jgi:hypothetical protein
VPPRAELRGDPGIARGGLIGVEMQQDDVHALPARYLRR